MTAFPIFHSHRRRTMASVAASSFGSPTAAASAADASAANATGTVATTTTAAVAAAVSTAHTNGAALSIPFPTGYTADLSSTLAPLHDESSSYAVVAKVCLQISSFASHPSSTNLDMAGGWYTGADVGGVHHPDVWHSVVWHDATYQRVMTQTVAAVTACAQHHADRKCRYVAVGTLGLIASAAYGRLRHSPLLYTQREPYVTQLEDMCGTDIPVTLLNISLDEADHGVTSAALQALGRLVTCVSPTCAGAGAGPATTEDELLREQVSIATGRSSPYASTLRQVVDEDCAIPAAELAARTLAVLGPRALSLLDRVLHLTRAAHQAQALPVVTAVLVMQLHIAPTQQYGCDRTAFAKRWVELDVPAMVKLLLHCLLVPALQHRVDPQMTHASCLAVLRLYHASAPLILDEAYDGSASLLSLCTTFLLDDLANAMPLENKRMNVATCLIASRGLTVFERVHVLQQLVPLVASLPAATTVPHGVSSAGARVVHGSSSTGATAQYASYKMPGRINYWTEMALNIFLDGPPGSAAGAGKDVPASTTSSNGSAAGLMTRKDALQALLSCSSMIALLSTDTSSNKIAAQTTLLPRDEILLSFCTVAVSVGRRFREGGVEVDRRTSSTVVCDPTGPLVAEWLELSWQILTMFSFCVQLAGTNAAGKAPGYLDEDLSLLTAALASYVQLLQEYLHFVGCIHPASSVCMKLTANACPPHLLWDKLTESAQFLGRLEGGGIGDDGGDELMDSTTQLLEELVKREVKPGIPNHHMRLFILTLAADHWVQGRVFGIRKQFETTASASTLNLNVAGGREILMALSPNRILTKLFAAHQPSSDKKKRDPIKKLAQETVIVCVACIESIALMACDWRRRFGSSQESKHLVSVAVGLLQGKVDESPADDMMKALTGPISEAAVARVQAFYESESNGALDQTFPASELLMQPVRTKIKPLISSAGPSTILMDDFLTGYLTMLSQKMMDARIDLAVLSFGPADSLMSPARPPRWLRLSVPPVPEIRDGRARGIVCNTMAAWGVNVQPVSAPSDAAAVILAYTPRRYFRYDGEDEFRMTMIIRAHNMTAVEFPEGLKLELSAVYDSTANPSKVDTEFRRALGLDVEEPDPDMLNTSATVAYRQELKANEFITWEVAFDARKVFCGVHLLPTVVFRNVEAESENTGAKWVGEKGGGDSSIVSGDNSKTGEDDFQVTKTESGQNAFGEKEERETENVAFPGEKLLVSPIAGMQPCPLVFYKDAAGDADAFRLLWFRMPCHAPPIYVTESGNSDLLAVFSPDALPVKVATVSTLYWSGEAIPGGFAVTAWAFATLSGSRILCVLAELEDEPEAQNSRKALYFRGEDNIALGYLMANGTARAAVVASLMPGMIPK